MSWLVGPDQKRLLEELRDLAATIEDLETERAAIPVEEQEHEALTPPP